MLQKVAEARENKTVVLLTPQHHRYYNLRCGLRRALRITVAETCIPMIDRLIIAAVEAKTCTPKSR